MSSIKKFHFNLVEITLAVAVIAIGMGSILVLFPVGVNSHKEAIANNNLSDISEYILGSIEAKVMEDWAQSNSSGYNPDTPGSINNLTLPSGGFLDNLESSAPAENSTNPGEFTLGNHIGYRSGESASDTANANLHAKFFLTNKKGVFLYEQATVVDGERVPDFSAVVRLWKEYVKVYLTDGASSGISVSNYNYAVSVNLEVSWPAEAPYENREKRSYKLDLYNPYYAPATPDDTPPVTP